MKKIFAYLIISLIALIAFPVQVYAISDKIPTLKGYFIPSNAELVAQGYDWAVYKEETEMTEFYIACKLYLENTTTKERYKLLETKGYDQQGTLIPIKARNRLAYGNNEVYTKTTASYEYGYIEAIDEVFVLAGNKILLSGVPDARNYYNYVVDLDTYTAVHIEAYYEYVQTIKYNGSKYLEFLTSEYGASGYHDIKVWYDIDGNYVKNLGALKTSPSGRYRMVFYIWHSGDRTPSGKSQFGHSFVFIPQIGYVGYGGVVSDHRASRAYATDSCVVYINEEQLAAAKEKLREWQRITPKYSLGRRDCTSFAMDIADAAGVQYGNRTWIQWPAGFMDGLHQYNPSAEETRPTNGKAVLIHEEKSSLGPSYTYTIPCNPGWFNNRQVHSILLPNGYTIKYQYLYDDNYVGCRSIILNNQGGSFNAYVAESHYNQKYVDPWFPKADHIYEMPMHYIAFWAESANGQRSIACMVHAQKMNDDNISWYGLDNGMNKLCHSDVVYEIMGINVTNGPTLRVTFAFNHW